MHDLAAQIRRYIARRLDEGFDSPHEIISGATAYFRQHGRRDLRAQIRRLVAEMVNERRLEQAEWSDTTDCDRLDQAFASLDRRGILARQNFACCNNCGFTEIWEEVEKEQRHRRIEGYVFYHLQCTEHAIKSGELLLAYGCVEEDVEKLNRIAAQIVEELRRVGLDASWAGTPDHPISVNAIRWRRRV
jgi:hypothetical protein